MRAVIYCRVSTKEQTQNLSLPTQLRACRDYCARHDWTVVQKFEDAGESAKTTDRPEFQRLLEYCRLNKGRVQFVVVLNLSRFSRNAYDHSVVRALLLRLGVALRSVSEPISDDPVGKLTENMLAAIAQFDNDQKAERTKAGMLAALQRGQWTWRAPLGYVNGDKRTGEPSLLPDSERSGLIQRAFQLVASGDHAAADALRVVTSLGLTSRSGRPLTQQTFGALLRKPLYTGTFDVPGFGLHGVRGDFQALISRTLFSRVQAVLDSGGSAASRKLNNPDFPLRRFVVCDRCSTPLTGSSPKGRSKRYSYYHCRRCKGVRIRRETLEARFVEVLDELRPNAESMGLFRAIGLAPVSWTGTDLGLKRSRRAVSSRS